MVYNAFLTLTLLAAIIDHVKIKDTDTYSFKQNCVLQERTERRGRTTLGFPEFLGSQPILEWGLIGNH